MLTSKEVGEAFEELHQSVVSESSFVVKSVIHKGEEFDTFGDDYSILNLLRFKGTGEQKKFQDVQKEYARYVDLWWDNIFKRGPNQRRKWIDSFVIEKNYRLLFSDGDITMKKSIGEKVS